MKRIDHNINVDVALDAVLKASGSALENYTLSGNLERMREAMRNVMSQSYIAGSNDCYEVVLSYGEKLNRKPASKGGILKTS